LIKIHRHREVCDTWQRSEPRSEVLPLPRRTSLRLPAAQPLPCAHWIGCDLGNFGRHCHCRGIGMPSTFRGRAQATTTCPEKHITDSNARQKTAISAVQASISYLDRPRCTCVHLSSSIDCTVPILIVAPRFTAHSIGRIRRPEDEGSQARPPIRPPFDPHSRPESRSQSVPSPWHTFPATWLRSRRPPLQAAENLERHSGVLYVAASRGTTLSSGPSGREVESLPEEGGTALPTTSPSVPKPRSLGSVPR